MNKLAALMLLMASVMLFVRPAPVAAAGTLMADEVTKIAFQGDTALATFSSIDPTDPCIESSIIVSATDGRLKEGPGGPQPTSEASVSLFEFNNCTQEVLLSAFNATQLSAEAFTVQNQLQSATLATTAIDVCDSISGDCFVVDVQVTWSGTGEIVRDRSKFISNTPGCKFMADFIGSFREAQATATVTSPELSFSGTSDFAQLAKVKNGTMEIGCEP